MVNVEEEEARELAFAIVSGEFEEMLDCHDIKVPSDDPQRATSNVALCMPERDKLRDGIVRLLERRANKIRVGTRRRVA